MDHPEYLQQSCRADGTSRIKRGKELAVGFLTWQAADNAFDYLLYPAVILWIGPFYGGFMMAILSLFFCLALMRLYDRLGRDWLGIELLKEIRLYDGPTKWKRLLGWILRRGNLLAFVVLSVKYDPFITTAYLRQGAFNGMERRDWAVFLGSWIIGNVTWTFLVFGGLSAVIAGWELLWTSQAK